MSPVSRRRNRSYAAESGGLATFRTVSAGTALDVLAPALAESYRCVDAPVSVCEM